MGVGAGIGADTAGAGITEVGTIAVDAGPRMRWLFVRLAASDGTFGLGEASDSFNPKLVRTVVAEHLAPSLLGEPAVPATAWTKLARVHRYPMSPAAGGFPIVTAISAIEQALWDMVARRAGLPLVDVLGGRVRPAVDLYANVNRGLHDRSPTAFADAARRAVDAGFKSVKCAPFDDVVPGATVGTSDEIRDGLKRVGAIREAIPDGVGLLVDCHGRFDRATAAAVVRSLELFEVGWIEEPMRFEDDPEGLTKVRASTGVAIAAGELLHGVRSYRELLHAGAVDVVMTDVKHSGGLAAVRSVAALTEAKGALLSLHNPAGPVASLHSAHLSAALGVAKVLEFPFADDRTEAVARLMPGAEHIEDGRMLLPDGAGIGADFDAAEIERTGDVRRVTT